MSVFTFHDAADTTLGALLGRATEQEAPVPEASLVLSPRGGPPLGGRHTAWHAWTLAAGADDLIIPSSLSDGDPDDTPYRCRGGWMAHAEGTDTVYVFTDDAAAEADIGVAVDRICEAARMSHFAPRASAQAPIPAELLALRAALVDAFAAAGLGVAEETWRANGLQVYATRSWVQVESDSMQPLLVEPEADSLRLAFVTEVYVDGMEAEEAERAAEEATVADLEPVLEGLGFARSTAEAGTSEEDEHAGADVVDWVGRVAGVAQVPAIVQGLSDIESPLYLDFG